MNLFRGTLLFAALLCVGLCASRKKTNDMARAILARLENTSEYNKEILPLDSLAGPVRVNISIYLRQLDFDEKNMKMTTDMTFRMRWRDLRLRYPNSRDVDHITFTDFTKFWIPDPFFKNSYDTNMLTTIHPEAYIRIFHTGDVLFSARYLVNTHCPMDLSRFPHDKQTCPISLASYGYDKEALIYEEPNSGDIHISKNEHSQQFYLTSVETMTCDSGTSTGAYSCIQILVNIDRKMSSYITGWYVPCMLFVVVSFFSHLVSAQNLLPRLVLCLGPLLSLSSSSLAYRSEIARVGYTTALDVYTGVSLLTIFLTLLQSCITYYYYSNKQEIENPIEEKLDGEEPKPIKKTKMERFKEFVKTRGDFTSRVSIIGFYVVFIFLYLLAYST